MSYEIAKGRSELRRLAKAAKNMNQPGLAAACSALARATVEIQTWQQHARELARAYVDLFDHFSDVVANDGDTIPYQALVLKWSCPACGDTLDVPGRVCEGCREKPEAQS